MSIYIWWPVEVSDMQWPCPDGFHIPSKNEWDFLYSLRNTVWLNSDTEYQRKLHMPRAWYLTNWDWTYRDTYWYYWTCDASWDYDAYILKLANSIYQTVWTYKWDWCLIRPFKDEYITPDSSRETISGSGNVWIFYNSSLWLISISDGTNWVTMADKNLWASVVYNYPNAISSDSSWLFFQWWNNYMFPFNWATTTSSTRVDANAYWPWNYYNSSVFITWWWWDTSINQNLRWWVSQWISTKSVEVQNIYIGEYGWKPWSNTIAYWEFDWNLNDSSGNWYNLTATSSSYSYWDLQEWKYVTKGIRSMSFTTALTDTQAFSGNFTLSFYINLSVVDSVSRFLWWYTSTGVTTTNIQYESWQWWLQWYNLNESWRTTWSWTPSANTWYNIIITWDWTAYTAYLNWVSMTKTRQWNISQWWISLCIWNNDKSYDGYWMQGSLDNVIIENRVRTSAQVQLYFNQTKSNYWL